MNVVGLDLSLTSTGFADRHGNARLFTTAHMRGMLRIVFIRNQILNELLLVPDLVVAVEGYSFGSKSSHAHELGELGGVVRCAMYERGITWVDVPPTSLKKYATGKGTANKEAVLVAAVKRLGYEGHSSDEADALWARAAVSDALGQPVVEVPAAHREVLHKLDLPEYVRGGPTFERV